MFSSVMDDNVPNTPSPNYCLPGIVLKSAITSQKLSVCSINIQSICARKMSKFEELKQIATVSNIDVICVVESWLNDKVDDNLIHIDDYNLVRHDRVGKLGGGILIYVKKSIKFKVIDISHNIPGVDNTEFIFAELNLRDCKVLLGAFYNPPPRSCAELIYEKLSEIGISYNEIIMLGDFNTNLMDVSTRKANDFKNVLSSLDLTNLGIEPTYFYNNGCSQLDLIMTNRPSKAIRFNQINVPGFSNHDLVFASFDYNTSNHINEISYRDYKHMNPNVILEHFNSIDWTNYFAMNDPNDLLDFFNENIGRLFENCVPLRTFRPKKPFNPWFNATIQRAIIDRDLMHRQWKTSQNERDHAMFRKLRNKVTTLVKKARKDYYEHVFNANLTNSEFWTKIKRLGLSKNKSSDDLNFSANEINAYFSSNFSRTAHSPINNAAENVGSSFNFNSIDQFDVINAIYEIRSNASGLNDVPIKFIKEILPLLLEPITYLFNSIIWNSMFPVGWKTSKIIPIKKKANVNSLSNLRPISILPALSKAFERTIKKQICAYIESNNLLSQYQSGYRPSYSTKTAMLKVIDDIGVILDRGSSVVMVLLDFSKAFDSISHSVLCRKLRNNFGFSEEATNLIFSYLDKRQQAVFYDGVLSNYLPILSGVPQGSVLGPILFSLYVNDLPSILRFCCIHLFADDVQLYFDCSGFSQVQISSMLNEELERIRVWSDTNSLKLNASKTNALFISNQNSRNELSIPDLFLGREKVSFVDQATILGITIETKFSWDKHILKQCGKIYAALRSIYSWAYHLNTETKLKLFKSSILPYFISIDFLLPCASAAALDRIRIALNSCVRFVYNLDRYSRVTHLQKNLLGFSFYNFPKARSNIFMHQLIKTRKPEYLYSKLQPFQSDRLRKKFIIPRYQTAQYSKSFFVRGVVYWNELPQNISSIESRIAFKNWCRESF